MTNTHMNVWISKWLCTAYKATGNSGVLASMTACCPLHNEAMQLVWQTAYLTAQYHTNTCTYLHLHAFTHTHA